MINAVKVDSDEIDPNLTASSPQSKPPVDLNTSNAPVLIRRGGSSGSGAGAIFLSRLATVGFKFPFIRLNEMDEKFLFDLEVRFEPFCLNEIDFLFLKGENSITSREGVKACAGCCN